MENLVIDQTKRKPLNLNGGDPKFKLNLPCPSCREKTIWSGLHFICPPCKKAWHPYELESTTPEECNEGAEGLHGEGRILENRKKSLPLDELKRRMAEELFSKFWPRAEWGCTGTRDDTSWREAEQQCWEITYLVFTLIRESGYSLKEEQEG